MKKILTSGVVTLGLLGAAVAPAFASTSAVASSMSISQAGVTQQFAGHNCRIKHWTHRWGHRDHWGGHRRHGDKIRRGGGGKRDHWDRHEDRAFGHRGHHNGEHNGFEHNGLEGNGFEHNGFEHNGLEGNGLVDDGLVLVDPIEDEHGFEENGFSHRKHRRDHGIREHRGGGRHRNHWEEEGGGGHHSRWNVHTKKRTVRRCWPRHGVHAGGGGTWHGRSVLFALKPGL
jgi:hypothetical protein